MARKYFWDLEGHLVGQGSPLGLDDLPTGRYFSYIWWFLTHEGDMNEVEKFRNRLWMPPLEARGKPIPKESPWSPENETKAFAAFKAETKA